jgi:hypothetical protein
MACRVIMLTKHNKGYLLIDLNTEFLHSARAIALKNTDIKHTYSMPEIFKLSSLRYSKNTLFFPGKICYGGRCTREAY